MLEVLHIEIVKFLPEFLFQEKITRFGLVHAASLQEDAVLDCKEEHIS